MSAIATKVGVGAAWLGAAATAAGTVVILTGATSTGGAAVDLTQVAQGGWFPVVGALGIAGAAAWVGRGHRDAWPLPVSLCVLTSLPIVVTGADPDFRTDYPWGSPPSTALLVAAVGIIVALIGSLLLSRGGAVAGGLHGDGSPTSESNACARCARPVATHERICAHCGFAVGRYRSRSRG